MTMIVFGEAILECGSNASEAERELADPENWHRLCRAVERAYPNDPTRRLHPKSPTYKQWFSVQLTAESMRSIYLPRGCANAFLTLRDETICHYYVATKFAPGSYAGFNWNDPQFSFDWPAHPAVISDKDSQLPNFDPSML